MRNRRIKTFFNENQVCIDNIRERSFSQSPLKPLLLMNKIINSDLKEMLDITNNFNPVDMEDLKLAHTEEYINNVFSRTGNFNSNGLPWSENLVNSLLWTTGSLLSASIFAIQNPDTICFAPVSGMHHARPNSGFDFCTFSGQSISAIKIFKDFGMCCAYLDLDAHFGNSIEDTRDFNPLLNNAIPNGCNFNTTGEDESFVESFRKDLEVLGGLIKDNKIHYVVFAHGADSHDQDDLGGFMNTDCWVGCADIFANWVNQISEEIGRSLPIVLTLFGGYRKDNFDAVLNLHIKSLIRISNIICGNNFIDNIIIPPNKGFIW